MKTAGGGKDETVFDGPQTVIDSRPAKTIYTK